MVDNKSELDRVFGALSDGTRRGMLAALRSGELTVGQLAEPYQMSLAAAAKHVQVLERSGLIKRRKEGRTFYCSINGPTFESAQKWIQQYSEFWNSSLDTLTEILEQERRKTHE